MKKTKIFVCCLFFLVINKSINAQLWKKIQKNLKDKVEKKVEEKIDKETDKAIDVVLNGTDKSKDSITNQSTEILSTFNFPASLLVEINSGKDASVNFEFLLGNYTDIYGIALASPEMGEDAIIYNVITPTNITMFMDIPGMKMKKSAPQDQFSDADFSDKMPKNASDLQKTGATKTILGFTCHEYKYTNNNDYTKIWVAKDFPIQKIHIGMLGMHKEFGIKGFVLEMEMKYENEIAIIKAVEFNKNRNLIIHTNDYKSMGF